jgi:atypical dual specificity phosphatase
MIIFLFLYLVGLMGNHYIKVYCGLTNLLYMLCFIGVSMTKVILTDETAFGVLWHFRIPELLLMWWIPTIGYMIYILARPSVAEIVPGKVYLGNAAAAYEPSLLQELKITHVIELHDDSRKNDPSRVQANLLQLKCDDTLGSPNSMAIIEKQAVQYMDEALKEETGVLLVHCSAGASRSPALVAHWLVANGKESSVDDAVRTIRRARPLVDISPDHLNAIRKLHDCKQA